MRHQWISFPGSLSESLTVTLPTGSKQNQWPQNMRLWVLNDFKFVNCYKKLPLKFNSTHFGDIRSNRKSNFENGPYRKWKPEIAILNNFTRIFSKCNHLVLRYNLSSTVASEIVRGVELFGSVTVKCGLIVSTLCPRTCKTHDFVSTWPCKWIMKWSNRVNNICSYPTINIRIIFLRIKLHCSSRIINHFTSRESTRTIQWFKNLKNSFLIKIAQSLK